MMQTPNLHYLLLALLLATTINADSDVPGCACQADTTCANITELFPDTLACSLTQRSDPPYDFPGVLEQPVAICDGLEADPEFQEAVGNESRPYYFTGGGETIGPYYETGFVVTQVAYGTCEDLINEQNSCPLDNESDDDDELLAFSGTSMSGVRPNACGSMKMTLPTTNSTLDVSSTCESYVSPDKNITAGYEDSIFVQAVVGTDSDKPDLCDAETAAKYPALTRADWIEPKAGSSRRYIRHQIVDVDGTEYCLLVLSIGNEPCRGPPPAPSSSHTTNNGRHVLLFVLVGQLLVAVLSWVL